MFSPTIKQAAFSSVNPGSNLNPKAEKNYRALEVFHREVDEQLPGHDASSTW